MAIYKRFSPNIRSAFSFVVMIAVWIALAPLQVGGMAAYIIVIGKSMEPNFHKGDLVIVHKEPIYNVGDAIVYRNAELNNFIFHRIIPQELGQYTLKGDNNAWVDDYKPSHREVIGKLWLHIPRGGIAIQKIRSPFVMALLAGAFGAALANSLFAKKTKGIKSMNDKSMREWLTFVQQKTLNLRMKTKETEPKKSLNFEIAELLEGSFFALGLVALASLILAIIAFSRPTSRMAQNHIRYEHLGIYSYSASTPQGVYDADTIKSGDPIFTNLTCSVNVSLQYTLIAGQAKNVAGTYRLTAMISEQVSGWHRVVPLQETTSFAGTAFGTTATLDLCKIEALTKSMEEKTVTQSGAYTLVVTPNIQLNGELEGRGLESTFNPALTFRYDRVQFYLQRNDELGNPLALTEVGILTQEIKEANTMLLLGREITIPALRSISLIGFVGSLSGLILLGLKLRHLSLHNPQKFFQIRYNSIMIDTQSGTPILSTGVVDVTSMEALAKLAERFNTIILHEEQTALDTYYVQANGMTYRFTMNNNEAGLVVRESEIISQESNA